MNKRQCEFALKRIQSKEMVKNLSTSYLFLLREVIDDEINWRLEVTQRIDSNAMQS